MVNNTVAIHSKLNMASSEVTNQSKLNMADGVTTSHNALSPIIQVMNLRKSYGKNHVLRGIDFSLAHGEKVAVLGPSGSGKSTFLRSINHLEVPTSGEIYYNGELITDKNIRHVRQDVGMVFQHFNLITNLKVLDNLVLAPTTLKLMNYDTAVRKARKLLRHIDLLDKINAYPASLSGGQKQRIAIIRAMMMEPKVLLFDEPTSALDPESIGDVLSLIEELASGGLTMMIVTHEMNFARRVADRIVFIDEGHIIEDAKPEMFFTHPTTERVQEFLGKVL